MNRDNPAERLHALLSAGKKVDVNKKCREAWGELLDAPPNSSLLISRLGKLMELPNQIILLLKDSYPDDGAIWSHWETVVNQAFLGQNLNANWDSFITKIDQHTLVYLKMSASMLDKAGGSKLIGEVELAEYSVKLRELLGEIKISEIDLQLKTYLIKSILRLLDAIEEYRITGAAGIQDAVEVTIGHARFDKEYLEFMRGSDLGQRLNLLLGSVASVVTIAAGLPALGRDLGHGLFALAQALS